MFRKNNRVTIYLSDVQMQFLKIYSNIEGSNMSETLRDMIDELIRKNPDLVREYGQQIFDEENYWTHR